MNTNFILRAMTLGDLPQVVEIDQLSFPVPWSIRTYEYEILNNESAHMVVLARSERPTQPAPEPSAPPEVSGGAGGIRRWLAGRLGPAASAAATPAGATVVGMGGMWCAVGEVHVSTIAVHPDWRGRHLGEALLAGMIARGIALGAMEAALEVRVSNTVAQNLYRKYGFEIVTRRPRYYHDNNEDAWVMVVQRLDRAYQARLMRMQRALRERVPYEDWFNGAA